MEACYEGTLRDNTIFWHGGFSHGTGSTSFLKAEMKAIQIGLHLAYDRGYRGIILQIGNKVVYQAVNKNETITKSCKTYLNNMKQILNRDWKIRVIHIFREANKTMNALANLSLSHDTRILLYDSVGIIIFKKDENRRRGGRRKKTEN